MKRKGIYLWLMIALMFLTSCGQGGGHSSSSGKITLTIMGKKSDLEKSYMACILERYEEATGNHLQVIEYEDEEFEAAAAEEFMKGRLPDLLLHFHNADLNRFSVAEHFYYLNEEEWVEDLTDSARAYCEDREGNILGLPFWENSVSGCYYNKTLLDSLGLKPAATQAEFDVLCQVLKDIGYTPICWPGNGCSWMFQFGLDPVFADHPELLEQLNRNEITYSDIPEVTDMVRWTAEAADKGWFGDDYLKTGWSEISSVLGSGSAVMTFIWDTWFYTDFEQGNQYSLDDFALMPVFMNTTDKGTYEGGNLNMMMVNKDSEQLDAALDFLRFCASPENYNAAFEGISTVSCFQGQTTNIQSPMVTEAAASIGENQRVSTAASRIVGYSAEDVMNAFDSLFRKKTDVEGCVKLMDEYRIKEAQNQGTEGF